MHGDKVPIIRLQLVDRKCQSFVGVFRVDCASGGLRRLPAFSNSSAEIRQ